MLFIFCWYLNFGTKAYQFGHWDSILDCGFNEQVFDLHEQFEERLELKLALSLVFDITQESQLDVRLHKGGGWI